MSQPMAECEDNTGERMRIWFFGTYGDCELRIREADADYATPPGTDAAPMIAELRSEPFYRDQLDKLDPEKVRRSLREYGAWNDEELSDHDANLNRTLWLACGDVSERPDDYPVA